MGRGALMRGRRLVTVLALAGCLSGCGDVQNRPAWDKKGVPVTPPSSVSSMAEPESAGPEEPVQVMPGPAAAKGPPTRPVEAASSRPSGPAKTSISSSRPANQAAQERRAPRESITTTQPPASAPAGMPVNAPVMLENIVPGAEPIEAVRPLSFTAGEGTSLEDESESKSESKSSPATEPAPPAEALSSQPAGEPPSPAFERERLPEGLFGEASTRPALLGPSLRSQPGGSAVGMKAPQSLPPAERIERGKQEVVASPMLEVNGTFLGVEDVVRSAGPKFADLPRSLSANEFRQRAEEIIRTEINNLVLELLVYAEARNRLTEEQGKQIDQQLDQELRKMITDVGGSRKKLEQDLIAQGNDLDKVLADRRRSLSVVAFLRERFYPAITVTRSMLWDYYSQHLSEFATPAKVQMQVIAAPYSEFITAGAGRPTSEEMQAAKLRARAVIEEAAEAVKAGEDFAQVAIRLSRGAKAKTGGVWPMMEAGNFREQEVEKAAFALPEGQVSKTIETSTGCYVVKAMKVQPGATIGFEQAQERIEQNLKKQKADELEQQYFQRLMQKSRVNYSEELVSLAVEQAAIAYPRR